MTTAHDFNFKSIDGGTLPMSKFKGKAVLVVNVASQCGLTPQYSGLEALWKDKGAKGLVVLGVPANNFGAQEPGTEAEIKTFCETRFHVDFPMTSKEDVIGAEAHPMYKWFASELGEDNAPKWNFHKYLINRDATKVIAYTSLTRPDDSDLLKAIDQFLGK
jgi:glutathione peroxidase